MKKTYAKLMAAALAVTSILPAVPTAADETAESTLNVAVGAQFTTFDPALNTETANNYVLDHLYAGMFRKDADGNVQNELCESYEVSDDGLTYTFTFHQMQSGVMDSRLWQMISYTPICELFLMVQTMLGQSMIS